MVGASDDDCKILVAKKFIIPFESGIVVIRHWKIHNYDKVVNLMGNLSTVLKQRRKEMGMTLAQIADIMGVAEATVQRWESGNIKTIRHDKIAKLAELLKVSPAVLMGWDAEPSDAIPFPEPTIAKDVVTFCPIGTVAAGYDEVAYEEYSNEPVEIPAHYLGGRPKAVTQ